MFRFGPKKQVFIDWELVEPGYGVAWIGDSDLFAWAGKQVRLRVRMRRARLYALQFV